MDYSNGKKNSSRKKDDEPRFCFDLFKLNYRTIKDGYALPGIEDILDCSHGAIWFSTLDLQSGYWQVELEEEAKPLTAFTVGLLGFLKCEKNFWAHQYTRYLPEVNRIMLW